MENPDYFNVMYNAVCYLCSKRIHIAPSKCDNREPEPHDSKPYHHSDGETYMIWFHISCEEEHYNEIQEEQ